VADMNYTKIDWPDLELPPINLLSFGVEDSPCVGLCSVTDGVCSGCLRSLDEITNWTLYDPIECAKILSRINKLKGVTP
jgi:predicted Fe-S protein YdhL (DUF1289 family)